MSKCHLCGGEMLNLEAFSALVQVTSDCCPWRAGGHLSVCQRCGTVQKPVTENWRRWTEQIYADYEIYSQGAGAEQQAFEQDTGTSAARSQKIVEWPTTHYVFPETGNLLDIGCGNGTFLRAFGARNPKWRMTGLELDSRNQQVIESIPGVAGLHVGSIESLQDRFDLIVLIHVLEHIPHPMNYLRSLSGRLSPGGLLLIEVPNLEKSPFDILVADHCTHFTSEILQGVVASAGFEILAKAADFVPKELSLLAQHPGGDGNKSASQNEPMIWERVQGKGAKVAISQITWLQNLLQKGQEIKGQVGIFGTAISSTWLAASLGAKVEFFVDEDRNRIGRSHLSHPIYHPVHAPKGSQILVPMRADIAVAIARRFKGLACKFVLPSV